MYLTSDTSVQLWLANPTQGSSRKKIELSLSQCPKKPDDHSTRNQINHYRLLFRYSVFYPSSWIRFRPICKYSTRRWQFLTSFVPHNVHHFSNHSRVFVKSKHRTIELSTLRTTRSKIHTETFPRHSIDPYVRTKPLIRYFR